MEQETTNQPEPGPAPVILRAKPLRVEANFRMSARLVSAPKPPVPPAPPRSLGRRLKDLSWKVAEKTLSRPEVQDFVIEKGKDCIEWVKTILESQQRRRHPAKAG